MASLKIRAWQPWCFFVVDGVWIVVLGWLAFALANHWAPVAHVHDPFGGTVPFAVPWAGALGGVAISLVGIADHQIDWNPARFAYWHLVRPVLGLLFGTVAVLIVVLLLQNVKATQTTSGGYTTTGAAILAVIAFVVGYREATFRALVTRVVDVILAPGVTNATAKLALVPSVVDFGAVTAGQPATQTAHLFNGSADTVHVAPTSITVSDVAVAVTPITAQDLSPSGSLAVELTWAPVPGSRPLDASLTVSVANVTVSARLQGTLAP
jgi:hypothetical protein